jgi:RluA family pseudouridine synthase
MSTGTPRTYHLSCRVDPYRDGWTLADFLAGRFRYHPPDLWRERLGRGAVQVNDVVAGEGTVVRKGDVIRYTILHTEPSVDFRYQELYRDDHVLAVAKSGNLPVHAGGKFIENTLIARLRTAVNGHLTLAHRLDRETSGVVLLARTPEAARGLQLQFEERTVRKRYLAVLRGIAPENVRVDAAIARREPAQPPYFRVVDPGNGRPSVTGFRRLALGRRGPEGEPVSFVEVVPESGRTNQIRVHAGHIGCPVLGDKIYGIPEELAKEFVSAGPTEAIVQAAGAERHLLHCAEMELRHPASGESLRVVAPVPEDFFAELDWPPDVEATLRSR